ncbi:ATP-binding protein [Deinococcus altitudinis]|uniref:ATP-binding protein n=1 Tax=Deinococcus altitudinis TaxID=468914 RepID=UPI003892C903
MTRTASRFVPPRFRLGIGGRLVALHLAVLVSVTLLLGSIEVAFLQRSVREELGVRALGISRLVASVPQVVAAAGLGRQDAALNAYVGGLQRQVGADYIVVGDARGIRLAHPVPERLGKPMEGGDNVLPLSGREIVNVATGSLGPAVRGKVPIWAAGTGPDAGGQVRSRVIGVVSTGYLMPRIDSLAAQVARAILPWFLLTLALGTLGALFIARLLKRQILNLEPEQIAALVGQHRGVLAALRDGVIAVDASGTVTLANEQAAELLTGSPLTDGARLLPAPLGPLWPELAAVPTDAPLRNLGLQLRGAPVIVNLEPLPAGGFMATFRDRAEVMRLAEELTQVRGFVEVLRAQTHEHLNRMHTISGLLQLGRPDEAIKVVREEVRRDADFRELLRGIQVPRLAALLTGKRDRAAELGLHFSVEPGSELSPRWESAGEALITAAGNLIENAFEALRTQAGAGTVEAGQVLFSVGEDPEGLQLEVTDNGPGVADHLSTTLFEARSSSRGAGRGYGLSNVSTRISALGGTLQYLRRGPLTVFQVSLPRSAAVSGDPARSSWPRETVRETGR